MKIIGRKKYLRCILAVSISAVMLTGMPFSTSAEALTAERNPIIESPCIETEAVSASVTVTVAVEAEAESVGQARAPKQVNITVDNKIYTGDAFILSGTTYVGIRQFSMFLGAKNVSWNQSTRTATIVGDGLQLTVKNGSNYMEANGRALWMEHGCITKNGTMFVPIRVLCKAFGYNVNWMGSTRTASAVKTSGAIQSGNSYYDSDSVLWLARIIHAEAEGEPLRGKIAVGNVVLNRKNSPLFPNTIYGVIFDKANGVQFTPTANGAINNTPNAESVIAAKLCLEGVNLLPGALFFVNVKTASSSWVSDNREIITVIGNHSFFA